MSRLPSSARVVVIGAGIVGNSLIAHLARLGWTDIVQLDKGPLPNPGGSTGHASNFIFPVDHSREMTALTLDSIDQYKELGVFTECGGIEVARTEERMEELRRRMASAKSWGVEPVSLVTAGGAAGIYNVTTVEAARGRGIGAAMTVAAVRHGADLGFDLATLQASTMGRPVYERLGFEFVCDLLPYRLPAPA